MLKPKQLLLFLVGFLFLSCNTDSKYPYAIKDFRKPLQPYLTTIVSKGIVMYYDSALRHMATDKELLQLGQSEHPILRAAALREIFFRKSVNHFAILMNHLDDTAIVATDAGEWGIWYKTVSDYIIEDATWKTEADKNKTIDAIITKHNYLRSAFTALSKIEPQEKYYPYIKDMAMRERKSIGYYDTKWIGDIEFALYGLAGFKKRADIKVIKDLLLANVWTMGAHSFKLMQTFPDTAYLEVLETYYKNQFYRSICIDNSVGNANAFIQAIAAYKHKRSAVILGSILARKPIVKCAADTISLKRTLFYAIWNNPCDAYIKLRPQIEVEVKNDEKRRIGLLTSDPIDLPMDTSVGKIRWW